MPTLTAEAHVAEALTGVADQIDASAATEVIVGDGGSHDRTREIAASFPFARVLEESDEGIHLGLNQGIEAATGDVVGFLNADDWLAVGGLNTVRGTFALNSELDFASGGVSFRGTGSSNRICVCRNPISIAGLLFGVPAINGRYFKQELLQRIGPLAPTVGLDADREFVMRLALLGANGTPLDDCTYCYRVHAGSSTIAGDDYSRNKVRRADLQLAWYLRTCNYIPSGEPIWIYRYRALARSKALL